MSIYHHLGTCVALERLGLEKLAADFPWMQDTLPPLNPDHLNPAPVPEFRPTPMPATASGAPFEAPRPIHVGAPPPMPAAAAAAPAAATAAAGAAPEAAQAAQAAAKTEGGGLFSRLRGALKDPHIKLTPKRALGVGLATGGALLAHRP